MNTMPFPAVVTHASNYETGAKHGFGVGGIGVLPGFKSSRRGSRTRTEI